MDFAAPEALNGLPVTPSADVYGLGKVLQYLSSYTTEPCSTIFQTIIQKATAYDAADRYETVRLFKEALEQDLKISVSIRFPSHNQKVFLFLEANQVLAQHILP